MKHGQRPYQRKTAPSKSAPLRDIQRVTQSCHTESTCWRWSLQAPFLQSAWRAPGTFWKNLTRLSRLYENAFRLFLRAQLVRAHHSPLWAGVLALRHLPQVEAAAALGMNSTTLKQLCSQHGLARWGQRVGFVSVRP